MNPKVDAFLRNRKQWKAESERLRMILLDCPLSEELKWGQPCYTWKGKNIVLIGGFKNYCSLLFFKGALLADAHGILVTPGKTQAGRLIKMTSIQEIESMEHILRKYIHEAIEVEMAGLKVKMKAHSDYIIPEELQAKFSEMPALKTAFEALTPGRQRAYLLHISAPKQARTRESRIAKNLERILAGKGLNDERQPSQRRTNTDAALR